jgi:16S rRNA U516 pseudouridylate synthase RsuA-like enzyme
MRRLDQLLANLGYCSRSEARDFLKKHVVTVRGAAVRDPSGKVLAAEVRFARPQRGLAPGQILALYAGERLLGGGIFA